MEGIIALLTAPFPLFILILAATASYIAGRIERQNKP